MADEDLTGWVRVGVRYCLTHNGTADETWESCVYSDTPPPHACDLRELYRAEDPALTVVDGS